MRVLASKVSVPCLHHHLSFILIYGGLDIIPWTPTKPVALAMLLGIRCASLVAIIATIGLFSTNHTFYIHSPAPRFLPRSINVLTATTDDLLALLQNGTVTSVQLVTEYEWRITRDNKAGHWLNAILSSAPTEALRIAKTRDEQRAQGKLLGPLHGVPYVVKVCPLPIYCLVRIVPN